MLAMIIIFARHEHYWYCCHVTLTTLCATPRQLSKARYYFAYPRIRPNFFHTTPPIIEYIIHATPLMLPELRHSAITRPIITTPPPCPYYYVDCQATIAHAITITISHLITVDHCHYYYYIINNYYPIIHQPICSRFIIIYGDSLICTDIIFHLLRRLFTIFIRQLTCFIFTRFHYWRQFHTYYLFRPHNEYANNFIH